jgi:NitT/TauT family transport system substrate-binding protein
MTSAATLQKKKDAFERYKAAYKETIDYMYPSPEALTIFAEIAKVPAAVAQKIPKLVPKSALNPDQIVGMDAIMAEAVTTKFTSAPLSKEKIAELVQMAQQPK